MSKKTTRRNFIKVATLTGAGFWAMAGNASRARAQANDRPGLAGFATGGKGESDIANIARNGCDVTVICDVDRGRLAQAQERYPNAKAYTDYRKAFDEMEKSFDLVTVSTPDSTHACIGLMAMRAKKHAYVQKPITRTIYEARLMGQVAREMGVVTQMGNQGSASNRLREGVAQVKAGVLGAIQAVHVWSNRPVWNQGPGRRNTMAQYAETQRRERPDRADRVIADMQARYDRELANVDWESWIGPSPMREYFPGLYHPWEHRGWFDFGTGALGDMACHTFNQPYGAADLKFPTSVQARSTGHDFDSFPQREEIKFIFPATANRPEIECWWYDGGVRPPAELMEKYGIALDDRNRSGSLIIGEKGVMYDPGDNGGSWQLRAEGGERFDALPTNSLEFPRNPDQNNYNEFYRAVMANDPSMCFSNFPDYAGPLTETILLGNLAVWAAPTGGPDGTLGEWGEKIEWDARNLVVTNVSSLKTQGVVELVKPVYREGHRLD